MKIGRNEPCPCASGRKYKYCCIARAQKERKPPNAQQDMHPVGQHFFQTVMTSYSQQLEPLRIFCKEHDFYFFRNLSLQDLLDLQGKLKTDNLSKNDFFDGYRKSTTLDYAHRVVNGYCTDIPAFKNRKEQIVSTLAAHFEHQFELAIPSFFIMIEGILRDLGGLSLRDNIKPTIQKSGIEESMRYEDADGIDYFNAYITKLYRGSAAPTEFTRNTVLHGANFGAFTQENSLLLLLTLLEIGRFVWTANNWPPKIEYVNQ